MEDKQKKNDICTLAVSLSAKDEWRATGRLSTVLLTLCCRTLTSSADESLPPPLCDDVADSDGNGGGGVNDDMVPSMLTLAGDGADMLVLESISRDDRPGDSIICPQP